MLRGLESMARKGRRGCHDKRQLAPQAFKLPLSRDLLANPSGSHPQNHGPGPKDRRARTSRQPMPVKPGGPSPRLPQHNSPPPSVLDRTRSNGAKR